MDLFTTITLIVSQASDHSEAMPLVSWWLFVRKQEKYGLLGIFLFVSTILRTLSVITAKIGIHNAPLYHLMAMSEVVLVYCFYSRLMFKRIIWGGAVFLLLLNLFNTFFIQHLTAFNSYSLAEDMIALIVVGLMHLFQLYNDNNDLSPLEERPDFFITSGFLIYASGSLFTYLMMTSILSHKAIGFFPNAWIFTCIANILKNFLISYGLWRAREV